MQPYKDVLAPLCGIDIKWKGDRLFTGLDKKQPSEPRLGFTC
ncbi:hypothetical protein PN499_25615 [Kamptonema animale CS-326]|nr:hypothetical protein [Kamptonema animale]MDB9514582.1 hypothetical protein [Kamptonema animale CS-326]